MLHEKPDDLIQSSIDSFEIEPDLLTLQRIEENITKTNRIRESVVEKYKQQNGELANQITFLNNEINLMSKLSGINYETLNKLGESNKSYDEIDNIFKLINIKSGELDNLKLSLAKNLNDLESQINSLNIERLKLEEEVTSLNLKLDNLMNSNLLNNPNSNVMRINLYKSLGISLDIQEGQPDKVLMYNKENGLTNFLKVTDQYSDYFITNYIWDRI